MEACVCKYQVGILQKRTLEDQRISWKERYITLTSQKIYIRNEVYNYVYFTVNVSPH
jgi:hypothetical protein